MIAAWQELLPFILVGFAAQLVDGALGMAFGVLSNAMLLAFGLPPVAAASAVRAVESFTTGVSGLAHGVQRNIDWSLFTRLVIPGILGGFCGAWLASTLHSESLRASMFVYLAAIGIYLFWRGRQRPQPYRRLSFVEPICFAGGFFDANGTGGWGPVVTGSLLAQGGTPRIVVGTVNAAEFFVTVTVLATFIGTLGLQTISVAVAGLALGGVAAAPLGAILARRVSPRILVTLAGGLLALIGLYGLLSLGLSRVSVFPRL